MLQCRLSIAAGTAHDAYATIMRFYHVDSPTLGPNRTTLEPQILIF